MALTSDLSKRLDDKLCRFFDNVALPNTTTLTSEYLRGAKVSSRVEVVVKVDEAVTSTGNITIDVLASATKDGTYLSVQNIVVGAGTFSADEELLRYTPSTDVEHYLKVSVQTVEDLSAKKFSATLNYTA